MLHLSEQQREHKREYDRKYYRERTSTQKLYSIIKKNFQNAILLTLYFNPAVPVSCDFVRRYLLSWDNFTRKAVGRKFNFVRITEYTDFETGAMVFRYIMDLTAPQCEKIADNWCMGSVRIDPLFLEALDNLQDVFPLCPASKGNHWRWWSHTLGLQS